MSGHWFRAVAALFAGLICSPGALLAELPNSEKIALRDLYDAMSGAGWRYSPGEIPWFSSGIPECEWAGVSCNEARAELQGISLAGHKLADSLPSTLGDLFHLVTLALSSNPNLCRSSISLLAATNTTTLVVRPVKLF